MSTPCPHTPPSRRPACSPRSRGDRHAPRMRRAAGRPAVRGRGAGGCRDRRAATLSDLLPLCLAANRVERRGTPDTASRRPTAAQQLRVGLPSRPPRRSRCALPSSPRRGRPSSPRSTRPCGSRNPVLSATPLRPSRPRAPPASYRDRMKLAFAGPALGSAMKAITMALVNLSHPRSSPPSPEWATPRATRRLRRPPVNDSGSAQCRGRPCRPPSSRPHSRHTQAAARGGCRRHTHAPPPPSEDPPAARRQPRQLCRGAPRPRGARDKPTITAVAPRRRGCGARRHRRRRRLRRSW